MKKAVGALAAPTVIAPILFLLLMVGAVGGITGSMGSQLPETVAEANKMDEVPVELRDRIKSVASAAQVDWALVAGYLQVRYGWASLPIPKRIDLAKQPVEEEVPCPEDQQAQDKKCVEERPPTRQEVEARWEQHLMAWLPAEVSRVQQSGGDPAGLGLTVAQAKAVADAADAIREIDALRQNPQEYKELLDLVDNETYMVVLRDLDWQHTYPLPGAEPHDDWHYERPQNPAMGLPARHQGSDLFAPAGSSVLAVTRGRIIKMGWNFAGGWAIDLQDEFTGTIWYYAHLRGYADGVTEGMVVEPGTVLGYVGTTGEGPPGTDTSIQTPHLHFGMYLPGRNEVTDPYPYLAAWWELAKGQ